MNRRLPRWAIATAAPIVYIAACLLIRATTGPVAAWGLIVGSLGLAAIVGVVALIAHLSAEQHSRREQRAVAAIERSRQSRAVAARRPKYSPLAVNGRRSRELTR